MGGDHKCPVCEATFTRPQHVARHMRSHTGDRPYKCQHCGDQFARSDLLSRHVNKCHANEKSLPVGNARRKGLTSATRATTSKQACDQCVQASLPCDGANPCTKCVQRKCRCTFVKFHRQTAPVGPGHNPPAGVYGSDFGLPTLPENAGVYSGPFTFQAQDYAPKPGHEFAPTWNPYAPQYPVPYYLGSDYHAARRLSNSTDFSDEHSVSSSSSSSNVNLPSEQPIYGDAQQPYSQHQSREGGFSSAFGLMSLEDPAVLAGLATDATPFFSNPTTAPSGDIVYPHSADSTSLAAKSFQPQSYQQQHVSRPSTSSGTPSSSFPAPNTSSPTNTKTPSASREAETRELREFWRTYLRTPLSGPFSGGTPQGEATPPQAPQLHPLQPDTYGGYRRQRVNSLPSARTPGPALHQPPAAGGERTTVHGTADDLRSYEAAVLARKPVVNLRIAPPRKRADKGKGTSMQSQSTSQRHSHTPSSLSNAFGTRDGADSSSPLMGGANLLPRPSYKRLASSVLEPESSKRVARSPPSNSNSNSASPASVETGFEDFEGHSPTGSQ